MAGTKEKTDWADTVLVPKSPLPMRAGLARREPEYLARWDKMGLYAKIRAARKGAPRYFLHDGPPYANGEIHMGHALNKSLKDFIVRYKTMRGFDAPFVPGWDCHGLPIEREVVREIGERPSRAEVRRACRAYAEKFVEVQRQAFVRLGVLGAWDRPYLTMAPRYEAKVLAALRGMWEKGLVYRALRPIHWCAECETALAEAEVEYGDHTSPQVTVAFPRVPDGGTAALIWTTTPWTLPANVAVAVHPDLEYVEVRPKASERSYWVAEALLVGVSADCGWTSPEVLARKKGRDLEGMKLRHPFLAREVPVVLGDFVTAEVGTGLVHIAPGHGADDHRLGLAYGLPVLSPVDDRGRFTAEVEPGELAGKKVFDANADVVALLEAQGALLAHGTLKHAYPHCWRCRRPIVFRATPQWFLKIDPLREAAARAVEETEWIPSWGRDRFEKTALQRPDWCLSRQRAWGVPIPAARCEAEGCGEVFLDAGIFDRLLPEAEKAGVDCWFEHSGDFLAGASCPACGGRALSAETDILDVWFDSGNSWYAAEEALGDLAFPADLYLEGSDQHRGWFQVSMWASLALSGAAPYRAVLTHGFLLDGEGRAMSKSLGNVIAPSEIVGRFGADVLRWWVASQNYREDMRLSESILAQVVESYKKIRNTWRFLVGAVAGYEDEAARFDPVRDAVPYEELPDFDRLALSRLGRYLEEVRAAYDAYDFTPVYHKTNEYFVRDLSASYLDAVKDPIYCDDGASPRRRAAQTVLYEIARATSAALAPILPFTTEEVWTALPGEKAESVHLADFPDPAPYRDEAVEARWAPLLERVGALQAAAERAKAAGTIRSPSEAVLVVPAARELAGREADLARLARVAEVRLGDGGEYAVEKTAHPKCPRCWRHLPCDGALCGRCREVVGRS